MPPVWIQEVGGDIYTADIWGANANDVWLVTYNADVQHSVNGFPFQSAFTSPESLNSVFGISSSDIWAVGVAGTTLHYNGTSWSDLSGDISVSEDVGTVFGTASNDFWACTTFGKVYHWNGSNWSFVIQLGGGADQFFQMWGAASNNIWLGSTLGRIYHYNGTSWSLHTNLPGGQYFIGFHGLSTSDVWAVGGGEQGGTDATIYHYNGTSWSLSYGPGSPDELEDVFAVASNDVWAVSFDGSILHYNGTSWSLNYTAADQLDAIWGFAADNLYAAGANSHVYRYMIPPTQTIVDDGNTIAFAAGVPLVSIPGTPLIIDTLRPRTFGHSSIPSKSRTMANRLLRKK